MAKSKSGVSVLKKINAEAKRLSKLPRNKNKKYATLRKEATAHYRAGSLGHVKRKSVGKKKTKGSKKKHGLSYKSNFSLGKAKKKASHSRDQSHKDGIDQKKVDITIGRISTAKLKSKLIAREEEKLAWALLMRDQATTAKGHRLASERISRYRSELASLKK
jgi:hypothetical protein